MDELKLSLPRLEELTFRSCEGLATQDELAELEQLILHEPEALYYYTRYARVHAKLRFIHGDALAGEPHNDDQDVFLEILAEARHLSEQHRVESLAAKLLAEQQLQLLAEARANRAEIKHSAPRLIIIPTWLAVVSGVAAVVMIGLGMYAVFSGTSDSGTTLPIADQNELPTEDPQEPVVAPPLVEPELVQTPQPEAQPLRIARVHNAVWADNRIRTAGRALDNRVHELLEGFIELEYPNGVTMIIRGPATFTPISDMRIQLDQGLARVHVVPGAEGFTVNTPTGDVVDLGTEFGVDVLDQVTTVQVISGSVEVQREQGAVVKSLIRGQAAAMARGTQTIEPYAPRPELYPADWSLVERGVQTFDKGLRLYTPPPSIREGDFENNNRVVIFQERAAVELTSDLQLCISETGMTRSFPQEGAAAIAMGTRVDSYLVHFDSVGQEKQMVTATATFSFDQPILGLIVTNRALRDSNLLFKAPGVQYPDSVTGLEGLERRDSMKLESLDFVRLSKDRRTLVVRVGTNVNLDQLRVITAADDAAR